MWAGTGAVAPCPTHSTPVRTSPNYKHTQLQCCACIINHPVCPPLSRNRWRPLLAYKAHKLMSSKFTMIRPRACAPHMCEMVAMCGCRNRISQHISHYTPNNIQHNQSGNLQAMPRHGCQTAAQRRPQRRNLHFSSERGTLIPWTCV